MTLVSNARSPIIPEEIINPPDQKKDTRIVMAKMVGYRRTTDALYTAVKRTPTGQNCATCKLSTPFMGLYKCDQHQFIPVTTDNNICDFFEA